MKQQYWFGAGVLALAFLAGCGGGGDSSTAADTGGTGGTGGTTPTAADKYVGTWSGCFSSGSGTGSHRESVTITRTGDASASFVFTGSDYAAAGCTGTPTATDTGSGTIALSGTKTIGTDTVDKGVITDSGKPAEKQVFLVKGTGPITLSTGRGVNDGGTLDADGYPTTLDTNLLTRQ